MVADAQLAEAMRRGLITPPAIGGAGSPPPGRLPVAAFSDLMAELDRDRGER